MSSTPNTRSTSSFRPGWRCSSRENQAVTSTCTPAAATSIEPTAIEPSSNIAEANSKPSNTNTTVIQMRRRGIVRVSRLDTNNMTQPNGPAAALRAAFTANLAMSSTAAPIWPSLVWNLGKYRR